MFRKITVLSRRAVIALIVALIAGEAGGATAWADGGWWDHDGPWDRHHHHHHDWARPYWFPHAHVYPFVVVPAPRYYVYVPPPIVVYLLPPVPWPHARPVVARPVSPVYRDTAGYFCRDYQATIVIDGRLRIGHGTACLERDGVWRLIG